MSLDGLGESTCSICLLGAVQHWEPGKPLSEALVIAERRSAMEAAWIAAVEARRKQLGWSLERVGIEAGFSSDYWGKLVRGEKQNPTLQTMERISRAVGLELFVAPPL